MTFWQTSSQAQKLTQIDAAIELGISTRALAKNLGCSRTALQKYAINQGRHFDTVISSAARQNILKRTNARRIHAINREKKIPETNDQSAFSIFKSPKQTHRILDMRIDDEEEAFA